MNKRVVEIELNINAVRVNLVENATQGDTNTHFLHLTFDSEVELEGYNLQVTYMPPYPETVPYVDVYTDLKQELEILIPNILLRRTGEIRVNFALSKGEEILTVNKSFIFEVIKTINGSSITAFPEGNLKLTLAQQIEKVTQLLEEAEEKVNDYNDSVIEKTNEFNENARTKTEEFDTNTQTQTTEFNENSNTQTTEFNENVTTKTNEFNTLVENSKSEIEDKATESANTASTEANKQVVAQQEKSIQAVQETGTAEVGKVTSEGNTQVQAVTNEGTKQVDLVVTKGTEEVEKIQAAVAQGVRDVNANKDAHVKAVTDEGNKQVLAVGNKGTEEVSKVQSAGAKAVEDVNANKTANIQAVTEEGTKQIGLVADKGAEQTKLVTDEGTKQTTAVENKGTEQISLVTAEGNKQLILTQAEAIKVIEQLKSLIAGNPDTSNAQALSGKSRIEFERDTQALAGKYAGNFPLTSAVKDAVYLVPATGKFYVCTQAYNGSSLTAPNANFEELSVYKNRDKLGNLFEFGSNKNGNYFKTNGIVIQWLTVHLSPNQAIESGGLIKLKLPISIKYGYSTSISRQYNNHLLGEGYYTCVPVSTNEIGIRLDDFRNSLDKTDTYYITIIGSPLR